MSNFPPNKREYPSEDGDHNEGDENEPMQVKKQKLHNDGQETFSFNFLEF